MASLPESSVNKGGECEPRRRRDRDRNLFLALDNTRNLQRGS